jgi:hypothetical protein
VARCAVVPVLTSVTAAPETTAPDESRTVPRMDPNVDCARDAMGVTAARQQNTNNATRPQIPAEGENLDILLPSNVEYQIAIRRTDDC